MAKVEVNLIRLRPRGLFKLFYENFDPAVTKRFKFDLDLLRPSKCNLICEQPLNIIA